MSSSTHGQLSSFSTKRPHETRTSVPGGRQKNSGRESRKASPYQPLPLKNEGTELDVDKFISNLRVDAGLRLWYTRTHKKSDDEFYKWFDEENAPSLRKRVGTVVHGARPASNDKTVCYTIIAAESGHPALTIRWWFGHEFGYNFDLIDPQTRKSVYAPSDLAIDYWQRGCWLELLSFNEGVRRCYEGRNGNVETSPPRWVAEPGSRLRFKSAKSGSVWGDVFVPYAPKEQYAQYYPIAELPDAI